MVKMFEESKDLSDESRSLAERCRDYYDGDQLTADELATLRRRKQPPVVNNRIAPKVDYLLGVEAQTRTDPKAYPRTPNSDDAAEAVTDSIRYVCDNSDFDLTASECFENLTIEGVEACIIEVVGDKKEIIPRWVSADRSFYDPHAIRRDFSDSTYNGVVAWMDVSFARSKWPKSGDDIDAQISDHDYPDKPSYWTDSGRKRIMVCEMYFERPNGWYRAVFTKGTLLEPVELSAYKDEDGAPCNAMVMQSYKIDRRGCRYGAVKILLDIQDEINKRKSKSLHASNSRQTWSKAGMLEDINGFKREVAKPDGHIEFPVAGEFGKDFGIMPDSGMSAQQFAMYQESVSQIDTVGANSAAGASSQSSGRAIQALQQAGQLELGKLFDSHSQFKKRVYRKIWNCIRQFWTEERWVRVTDDEENVKFVGINKAVTVKQKIEAKFGPIPADHPINQDPRVNSVAEVQNRVAEIDVDIIIDEVPDTVNLQSEQLEMLMKMYQANPNGVPWEAIIEMSSLRNKDKILGKDDPGAEQRNQLQQQAEQIQMAEKQADIEDTKTETALTAQKTMGEALQNQILRQAPITSTRVVV